MERINQVAVAGVTASTGTLAVQQEKRIDLLDIDISFGMLPFNLPLGNVIVLVGFCFSAYAYYQGRIYAKQKKRRKEDIK